MQATIKKFEQPFRKSALPPVHSGDTIRVHHLIKEGGKQRVQVFEGVVIRTAKLNELQATVTVRRIASGVGVEKSYLLHSPNVSKLEIIRRAQVRRNFLSYLRNRRGKSARLGELGFDKLAINANASAPVDEPIDEEITEIAEESVEEATTDGSIDEVVKEEEKEAAADEPGNDPDSTNTAGESTTEDEAEVEVQEVEKGVEKADDEDTRNQ